MAEMREDLKGQNLTFTEIAKLVGENWQNLDRHEKEPYETQAQEAKERYSREMNEYKKTPEYQKYCDYLQEFRKRQATQGSYRHSHGACAVRPLTHIARRQGRDQEDQDGRREQLPRQ